MRARLVAVNFDIVADAVRREKAHHAARRQGFFGAQFVEHLVGVFKQPLRLLAHNLIFQNARIFPGQRPGHKERRPVDVITQRLDACRHFFNAQTVRGGRRVAFPVKRQIVFTRGGERHRRRARFFTPVLNAHGFILFAGARDEIVTQRVGEQRRDHAHGARGVLNIDRRPAVVLLDFHRRMGFRGGRAANEQRQRKALALHLFRHVHHLIKRRRDKPGKPDDIGVYFTRGFEDFIRRHHHAEINNFVVVALEHHADDIFADVVHVAFHGREHNFAVALAHFFTGLDVRLEVRHRLLHHAG